jgi:hypothetical protein
MGILLFSLRPQKHNACFGVHTALRSTGCNPAWINWFGVILAVALILGGLSFVFANPMLTTILFASLPILLIWVASVSFAVIRKTV